MPAMKSASAVRFAFAAALAVAVIVSAVADEARRREGKGIVAPGAEYESPSEIGRAHV